MTPRSLGPLTAPLHPANRRRRDSRPSAHEHILWMARFVNSSLLLSRPGTGWAPFHHPALYLSPMT